MGHGADLLTIDITGDHMSYAITARALRGSTRAAVPAPFPAIPHFHAQPKRRASALQISRTQSA